MNPTLKEAIAEAKDGDRTRARQLLLKVVDSSPQSEAAWLWLAYVLDDQDRKRQALETALSINPESEQARAGLAQLERVTDEASTTTHTPSSPGRSPEVVHYQANGILISNRRATFAETTYSLSNITSVSHIKQKTKHRKSSSKLFRYGMILLVAAGLFSCGFGLVGAETLSDFVGLVAVLAIALIVLSFVGFNEEKTEHIVRIRSASGEADAYTTYDAKIAHQLVQALNNAIIT